MKERNKDPPFRKRSRIEIHARFFRSSIQHLYGASSSPALAGLAITYALNFSWLTNEPVFYFATTEKMMVGVERILEYAVQTPLEEEEEEEKTDDSEVEVRGRLYGDENERGL